MRILILLCVLFSMFFALSSCKSTKGAAVSAEDIKKVKINPEDMVFMIQKGACFGSCPQYTLNIYKDRFAHYVGKMNTNKTGTYGKYLSKEDYEVVSKAFEKEDFFSYEDLYPSDIKDLPSIKIGHQKGGKTKTITGKRERPEAIHRIQFRLEQIADSNEGWTFISDDTGKKAELKTNKAEIIVDIAKGNQLARWFNKMKDDYGVQIVQKLSNNSDSWLITYNTKKHDADEFLAYLNADPVVKSAAFKVEKIAN